MTGRPCGSDSPDRCFSCADPDLDVTLFPGSVLRRLVLLVSGFGLMVASAGAQPDDLRRRFEAANEAYAEDRYEPAIDGYRSILDAGYASGALYHNLGNAYARLDRVGPAVRAYEKARQLRPSDPRLHHNLEHVRRRAGLPLQGLPPRGLTALVEGWSPLLLFGGGVLVLSIGGLAVVFRNEWLRHLGGSASVGWGLGSVGGLLIVVALGTSYVQDRERRAVVLEENAPLRAMPDGATAPDTTLPAGGMLEVQARRPDWIRVRLPDQTGGWVPTRAIGDV
jgi:tetratricopeptide (TPR) repeat protein